MLSWPKDRGSVVHALYVITYGADLAAAGLIGTTESPEFGSLIYFDWAPVTWDEPLDHRTVRITLPIVIPPSRKAEDVLKTIDFRTEKYVNAENLIDYYGQKGNDGKDYLTIRFHQNNVTTEATQRIQFYVKKDALPLDFSRLSEQDYQNLQQQPALPEGEGARQETSEWSLFPRNIVFPSLFLGAAFSTGALYPLHEGTKL